MSTRDDWPTLFSFFALSHTAAYSCAYVPAAEMRARCYMAQFGWSRGKSLIVMFLKLWGREPSNWLALFFKIFGQTWWTTRISVLLTAVTISLLLFYVGRRLRSGWEAVPPIILLAVGFPSWPTISHHRDSTLFALCGFAALLSWLDGRRAYMLVLAGVLAGLTTCFMQPKGLLLFISFVIVIWFRVSVKNRTYFRFFARSWQATHWLACLFCYI